MMLFRLINYFDVWGNAKDGYEVNNLCEEAILQFKDWPSKAELLRKLKRIGFFKKTARLNSIRFDENCADMYEIEDRKGYPLCRIENLQYEIEKHGKENYLPYHLEGKFPYGPSKVFDHGTRIA